MQGYIFKFPKMLVELLGIDSSDPVSIPSPQIDESAYRRADELTSVAESEPFSIDPALVERGVRSHAVTQNKLADFLISIGLNPLSPSFSEPNFDVGWCASDRFYVAEVKSLSERNEEKQMRLGLGQVLRYAYILKERNTIPVLVLERKPNDSSWIDFCSQLQVVLVWPEVLKERLIELGGT